MTPRTLIVLAALGACSSEPEREPAPSELPPGAAAPMDPAALLARASIDVRGVRPSPAELDAVRADPSSLDAAIEGFLSDPRFEDRLLAAYQEVFLTRMEEVNIRDYTAFEALVPDPEAFALAVGEEPLRIMAYLGTRDLPYDLAVTGDFTVIDEVLGQLFPTDREPGAAGWTVVHYTDGRPDAGVMSTNGLWWRYPSTASNRQRKRANTVSRAFVCRDFLSTPVTFDNNVDLLDEEALSNAIRTNEGCRTCHDTLEPIASYFWGFDFQFDDAFPLADALRYHPERERSWIEQTGVSPGWFGTPGDTLKDLGRQLLRDEAFDPCAVEHVATHLLRRPPTPSDAEAMAGWVRSFRREGRTIRSIWRAVLADPRYRGVVEEGTDGVPRKQMTPDLLRSVVLDLTGFDWTVRGRPVLERERGGVVTLAGGIDGRTVTRPTASPTTTALLVQDRLATAAASFAVSRDRERPPGERRLFGQISFEETPETDRAAMADQLAALYLAVLGREVALDGPEIEASLALWSEVAEVSDPETAWSAVLSALLRDPEFVLY